MDAFNINEKVVALNSNEDFLSQPRKEGEMYTILNIIDCEICSSQLLSITKVTHPFSPVSNCNNCGEVMFVGNLFFTDSRMFRKLDHSFGKLIVERFNLEFNKKK